MAVTPVKPAQPHWQSSAAARWLALLLGALPFYLLAIISGLSADGSVVEMLQDPTALLVQTMLEVLLFGGMLLAALWWLNGQGPQELNLRPAALGQELLQGTGLFFILLGIAMAFGLAASLFGASTVPESNIDVARQLAADPAVFGVFIGPVVWLRAALLEELSRSFILSRLWLIFPQSSARGWTILAAAALFGLAHLWQGWLAVGVTFAIGLALGLAYNRQGRLLPLVIAHGLYDSLISLVLYGIGSGTIPLPAR